MSGGAGTRLWPMSRQALPKQFLRLTSDWSLFQETIRRITTGGADPVFAAPIIIGAAAHADLIAGQLAEINVAARTIVAEPHPKNTAAVAAVAALLCKEIDPDGLVLLLPADHLVADDVAFRAAVHAGAGAAADGAVVTLGVRPTEAHTGYGYIERGAEIAPSVFKAAGFHEKPDRDKAEAYLKSGTYYWNAGIFLFAASTMLAEYRAYAPEILAAAKAAVHHARKTGARLDLDADAFAACPSTSVDYAIMEKTKRAAVVGPVDAGWSDVGSWSSLSTTAENADIFLLDANDCIVRTDGTFVGLIGANDLIVVASGDAVLVAPKSRAQDVKKIVDELKARGRGDLL